MILKHIDANRGGALEAKPLKHFLHFVLSLFNHIKVRLKPLQIPNAIWAYV